MKNARVIYVYFLTTVLIVFLLSYTPSNASDSPLEGEDNPDCDSSSEEEKNVSRSKCSEEVLGVDEPMAFPIGNDDPMGENIPVLSGSLLLPDDMGNLPGTGLSLKIGSQDIHADPRLLSNLPLAGLLTVPDDGFTGIPGQQGPGGLPVDMGLLGPNLLMPNADSVQGVQPPAAAFESAVNGIEPPPSVVSNNILVQRILEIKRFMETSTVEPDVAFLGTYSLLTKTNSFATTGQSRPDLSTSKPTPTSLLTVIKQKIPRHHP